MEKDRSADIEEVLEGIYRIKLPMPPASSVNAYLFRGTDAFDLLDPGVTTDESLSLLQAAIARLGLEAYRLRNIFLTHLHKDHVGAAGYFLEKHGSAVFFGDADMPGLDGNIHEKFRSREEDVLSWYRELGFPESCFGPLCYHYGRWNFQALPAASVTPLRGGEVIRAGKDFLKALPFPGHTPGSLCFHLESERALFAGDTLLMNIAPTLATSMYFEILDNDRIRSNPLGDFLESLGKLKRLDATVIFPGHGRAITDPGGLVDDYLLLHKQWMASILEILDGKSLTCYEISEVLLGGSENISEVVTRNLGVLSHLLLLKSEGAVFEVTNDGLTRYGTPSGMRKTESMRDA